MSGSEGRIACFCLVSLSNQAKATRIIKSIVFFRTFLFKSQRCVVPFWDFNFFAGDSDEEY
ncbi:MAG: hypothetical protein SPH83_05480 [Treponema sp.]|nr:hypothetical protein [Spirochaetales bacterium]MDY6189931.1 hypothetical protein [Treponema sp.]